MSCGRINVSDRKVFKLKSYSAMRDLKHEEDLHGAETTNQSRRVLIFVDKLGVQRLLKRFSAIKGFLFYVYY